MADERASTKPCEIKHAPVAAFGFAVRYACISSILTVNISTASEGDAVLLSFLFLICCQPLPCVPPVPEQSTSQSRLVERSLLTGDYRVDIPASDKLYSVVAGASSNLPFSAQQRFFIDLAVRLTPPDLLAFERQGTRISLGSSRAPRMTFVADGVSRSTTAARGHTVHVRLSLERGEGGERLVFISRGRTEDNFSVQFESIDDGKRLRVVRRIAAEGLEQPLVIRTIYNKISDVAHWELYGESQLAKASTTNAARTTPNADSAEPGIGADAASADPSAAPALRSALNTWIEATNKRDIDRQMSFYAPQLRRYYLMNNASQRFVRGEKSRVFAAATLIDIRAEEPEIIFQDGDRIAIMRYRKKYRVDQGARSRRGEVIQELRWQRTGDSWRIFSERDIRVLK